MASIHNCLASLARISLSATAARPGSSIPRFLAPAVSHTRHASGKSGVSQSTKNRERAAKKKKQHKNYRMARLDFLEQFSLCDAIRYVRAFEVGRDPTSVKYDLAVRIQSAKSGAVIRGRMRLPHPVAVDTRIGVICKDPSPVAMEARKLGAVAVGEEDVFERIRAGEIPFNRLICHPDSEAALTKAGLGRILGPKGMMPSAKTNTISADIKGLMNDMMGAENYRERQATIRLRVGQLAFTPQMLADNVKAVVARIKQDIEKLEGVADKAVHEVVLSSTNSPGFSLNGAFKSADPALDPKRLSGVM